MSFNMVISARRSPVITAGGSLPVCAGCKQRIYDEQYLQALNNDWHTVCFRYFLHKQQTRLNI